MRWNSTSVTFGDSVREISPADSECVMAGTLSRSIPAPPAESGEGAMTLTGGRLWISSEG